MTVVDKTVASQSDSLTFEFDLRHRPEKVWRALTDPVLLAEWLLPVVSGKLEPGAHFVFQTQPYPGWDGTVKCQMKEIETNKKLRYTWVVGEMLNTEVVFTLTPTPEGTSLTVVQSGFRDDQKQNWGGARYGWKLMGGKLEGVLAKLD